MVIIFSPVLWVANKFGFGVNQNSTLFPIWPQRWINYDNKTLNQRW